MRSILAKMAYSVLFLCACGVIIIAAGRVTMRPALTNPKLIVAEITDDEPAPPVDLPEPTSELVALENGATLEDVLLDMNLQPFESLAAFDSQGAKLDNATNYLVHKLLVPPQWWMDFAANDGEVLLHNHPSGNALSPQDVFGAVYSQVPWMMVVGDGYVHAIHDLPQCVRYSMTASELGHQIADFYEAELNELAQEVYVNLEYDGLPPGLWVSYNALRITAEEFSFTYDFIPLAEFDASALDIFSERLNSDRASHDAR